MHTLATRRNNQLGLKNCSAVSLALRLLLTVVSGTVVSLQFASAQEETIEVNDKIYQLSEEVIGENFNLEIDLPPEEEEESPKSEAEAPSTPVPQNYPPSPTPIQNPININIYPNNPTAPPAVPAAPEEAPAGPERLEPAIDEITNLERLKNINSFENLYEAAKYPFPLSLPQESEVIREIINNPPPPQSLTTLTTVSNVIITPTAISNVVIAPPAPPIISNVVITSALISNFISTPPRMQVEQATPPLPPPPSPPSPAEPQLNIPYTLFLASQFVKKKAYRSALLALDRVEAVEPNNLRLLNMRGSIYYKLKFYEYAYGFWKSSLQLRPNQPLVRAYFERVAELTGQSKSFNSPSQTLPAAEEN